MPHATKTIRAATACGLGALLFSLLAGVGVLTLPASAGSYDIVPACVNGQQPSWTVTNGDLAHRNPQACGPNGTIDIRAISGSGVVPAGRPPQGR